MDFMDIMFNKNKPFKPIRISGGLTNGRIAVTNPSESAKCLQESEKDALEDDIQLIRKKVEDSIKITLQPSAALTDCEEAQNDEVYSRYKFEQRSQDATHLPVWASKTKILEKIAEYPSVVIEGSTGCGKSTQIPQMILDEARNNQKACNIIVTQPRRIAARSLAERVADERGWELGKLVGYQIGLDKRFVSEDTRILYCTTGVLLEKLIQMKTLAPYTHIVLDEVHERDKDMDFLFIIIRMLWAKEATNVRVILMSATIDTEKFAEYFRFYKFNHWIPAPIIKVDKQSIYTVKEFYADDFNRDIMPELNFKQPGISDGMYKIAQMLVRNLKNIDKDPEIHLSAVLIFLPGIYEIGRFRTLLMDCPEAETEWRIFILHSLISTEEQQSIFEPVEPGVRKIILSTNIAESSITVPHVKFVIDFCLMKYLKSDSSKNFTMLEMDWASKNNCKQRAGRAGRTANGRCYRLISRKFYEVFMKKSPIPEMLLSPLEHIVLKAKTFDMEAPHIILGMAMDRPNLDDVANTVLTLKELGALHLTIREEGFSPIDGDLTNLGRIMSNLPVDVRSARLIVFGYCFGVLEEAIIMAAGLTSKSIFKILFERDLTSYTRRLEWSNGSGSDLFAILNAYRIWRLKHDQKVFGKNYEQKQAERDFCKKHCLDVRSLGECHQLVEELTQRLEKIGIRRITSVDRVRWSEQEKSIILKVVIAGAFYPNFFGTEAINNPMIEREAWRTLNGRDPDNTVFFTGFTKEHIRELYVDSIRNLFRTTVVDEEDINRVKVAIDKNSEKIFVTFDMDQLIDVDMRTDWDTKHCSIPGKTLTEVYKSVKMRRMNMPMKIDVMKPEKEMTVAEELGIGLVVGSTFMTKESLRDEISDLCIPKTQVKEIIGTITHVENCTKFWFQPKNERPRIEDFYRELNDNRELTTIIQSCTDYTPLIEAKIIVARDHKDKKLYRARLISWDYNAFTKTFKCTVCFIDFGRTQKCQMTDLYVFIKTQTEQDTFPARCFQCKLAEIQPSMANISGGNMWDRATVDLFNSFVTEREVTAKIYSVVNGIASVYILTKGINLNDVLIRKGFGEFCEENILSKNNHWKRQHLQKAIDQEGHDAECLEFVDCDEYYSMIEGDSIKQLDHRMLERFVILKGPRSPLESELHSALVHSGKRSVNIDMHSVNSVFLTSLQQDQSIKYMVASHVSQQSANNKEFTIHQTTLLPSIRGFGPLMAMVFCPAADLKRDQWNSRYISVRTGLGYNDDRKHPYFAEHDAVFQLDFDFGMEDLEMINQMRYNLDTLLSSSDKVSFKNRLQVMKKLKEVTLNLLTKERTVIETHCVPHEWKEYAESDFKESNNIYGLKSIFPLHGLPRLMTLDTTMKKRLKIHCTELRKMTMTMPRAVICQLCATDIDNVTMLRAHLMTRLHIEREKQIGFVNPL
ncbi:probable ATP-dependent RNA helicase spindle-E [Contarinia nasturtii]|uniref:probable ATP-dependent RNA helicase spindle-E n=1 Tax=Contarinia nasturtii TaxID=265458 RepID=UPI0012D3E816|nr:probable ATP-dependent RNA helicase spindle-E [Contarinia nasturtii]